jgi:hypothetical protein
MATEFYTADVKTSELKRAVECIARCSEARPITLNLPLTENIESESLSMYREKPGYIVYWYCLPVTRFRAKNSYASANFQKKSAVTIIQNFKPAVIERILSDITRIRVLSDHVVVSGGGYSDSFPAALSSTKEWDCSPKNWTLESDIMLHDFVASRTEVVTVLRNIASRAKKNSVDPSAWIYPKDDYVTFDPVVPIVSKDTYKFSAYARSIYGGVASSSNDLFCLSISDLLGISTSMHDVQIRVKLYENQTDNSNSGGLPILSLKVIISGSDGRFESFIGTRHWGLLTPTGTTGATGATYYTSYTSIAPGYSRNPGMFSTGR